jgi:autotransporter-associated beta strand protein
MKDSHTAHSAILAALLIALSGSALAQTELPHPTYTWSLSPTSGDWDTAANWSPEGVPDTAARAVFGPSSVTNVTASSPSLYSIEFTPGASPYTITGDFYFDREGVFNNSGVVQTFNGSFGFSRDAVAGSLVTYNTTDVGFGYGANAGSATFNIDVDGYASFSGTNRLGYGSAGSATFNNSGFISFHKHSTADQATFINYGGDSFGAPGAFVMFKRANAASSTIILYGGTVFGALGARCFFLNSSASSATLIAYGGAGDSRSGGSILFTTSSGGTARVEVFGNGNLDLSRLGAADNTIGSLEGDGFVYLGGGPLAIGGNNIDTTFAGTITEEGGIHEGGPGSISKTGSGTLTLTGASDYTDGTTVESGLLFVNNTSGSATGSGPVTVAGGGLSGAGIITGPLTVGTGSSSGAALAPGASGSTIGTLIVQNALSLLADATYDAQLNSTTLLADDVTSAGVTINGAKIRVGDLGASALASGTSFTLLNNTSSTPISGTFTNLPDGATVIVGNNTFRANYEGGDGNDLTLTVVP